jgi:hypothetical protein
MRPLYLSGLLAGSIVLSGTTPIIAQQMCKPALTVTECVRGAEPAKNMDRHPDCRRIALFNKVRLVRNCVHSPQGERG